MASRRSGSVGAGRTTGRSRLSPFQQLRQSARLPVAILDRDAHTRSLLKMLLERSGFNVVADYEQIPSEVPAEVMLFNLHVNDTTAEATARQLKRQHPFLAIIAICAPGPFRRSVENWPDASFLFTAILEKPFHPEILRAVLGGVQQTYAAQGEMAKQHRLLSSTLPSDALRYLEQGKSQGHVERRAVLFTDIRGSSGLLERYSISDYFASLNRLLSAQSACVHENRGEVIKFTGDGLMATFSGLGQSFRALRCARQLQQIKEKNFQSGIGLAEGLVLCGFVGVSQLPSQEEGRTSRKPSSVAQARLQFDVLGSNVHLAARLCSLAERGQIVLPLAMWERAAWHDIPVRRLGELVVKGFSKPVACVVIDAID